MITLASEILDLDLAFRKLVIGEVDLYTQVVPNIVNSFPITEIHTSF